MQTVYDQMDATHIELNPREAGTLLFLLEIGIKDLRKTLAKPNYPEDLKQSFQETLEIAVRLYLKVAELDRLDF